MRLFLLATLVCVASAAAGQGRLCASQETVLFGNELVGGSATENVTVQNCGSVSWSFTDVFIDPATGPAWHVADGCTSGLVLAPGGSCQLSVTFAPDATGQTSGGVWLDNTSDAPSVLIAFYGRGIDAQAGTASLSFSPTSLLFPRRRSESSRRGSRFR